MSDGFGRMAAPGQRQSSVQSATTEVYITLQHTAWASVAGVVVALALRYVVIAPAVRWTMTQFPAIASWLRVTEPRFSGALLALAAVLPWALLCVSFGLQILNNNWPPVFGPARPENGVFAGWGRRQPERAVSETESDVYTGRADPVSDPEQAAAPVEILIKKDGKTQRANIPDLTVADWQRLARYFQRGRESVSQTDLEKEAGFSKGPHGRARVVNRALTAWVGLIGVGGGDKPMAVPEFRQWVIDRGYARNAPLPHP